MIPSLYPHNHSYHTQSGVLTQFIVYHTYHHLQPRRYRHHHHHHHHYHHRRRRHHHHHRRHHHHKFKKEWKSCLLTNQI